MTEKTSFQTLSSIELDDLEETAFDGGTRGMTGVPNLQLRALVSEVRRLRHKCGEDRPGLSELADAWLAPNADEAVAALHNKYPGYEDLAFNYASDFATELMSRRYLTTELT